MHTGAQQAPQASARWAEQLLGKGELGHQTGLWDGLRGTAAGGRMAYTDTLPSAHTRTPVCPGAAFSHFHVWGK